MILRAADGLLCGACVRQRHSTGGFAMTPLARGLAKLRQAFRRHPALAIHAKPFYGRGRASTRLFWRDLAQGAGGALVDAGDAELAEITAALLAELEQLRAESCPPKREERAHGGS